jgi:hypothetical protein
LIHDSSVQDPLTHVFEAGKQGKARQGKECKMQHLATFPQVFISAQPFAGK